ncbi:MAG: acyl carrier protein [Chitinophagaceae bacterium]|nr:acyl carrier protein [Chitinophagaceae bacterium]
MSAVFDIPADQISDTSSPDTIEKWDSLNHMNLVSSLEEEFDVRFTDEEITEMLNFKLIVLILQQKKS